MARFRREMATTEIAAATMVADPHEAAGAQPHHLSVFATER